MREILDPDPFPWSETVLRPLFQRANQVAAAQTLSNLLDALLALLMDQCQAQTGMVYVSGKDQSFFCKSVKGEIARLWQGRQVANPESPLVISARERRTIWMTNPGQGGATHPGLKTLGDLPWKNAVFLPLLLSDSVVGVVQMVDLGAPALSLLELLAARLAPDVGRALQYDRALQHNGRIEELISIFGQIGATLDRDQLLGMLVDYAREVIGAEASSLFLVDEEEGDICLLFASNLNQRVQVRDVRVPRGKGIIGHVIETGQVVLVPDVTRDTRHYTGVDEHSGFITRSILAVPLRSRQVVLGGDRGVIKERIIGGFEALNKLDGTFDEEDAGLLITLANQAATVLEIADLYADATELFVDVIQVMVAAIDAKDPYTEGHSQRVSDFSVEIARELGMPAETLHHIRIGSLLHDIGKIGIPDQILNKPGRLTDEEYAVMKAHPAIGERIMAAVRLLCAEIPAIAQHHERLDGTGYPQRLQREEISLFGRVVAVADVFDALTSERPYRKAQSAEEALDYLSQGVDCDFDRTCVEALTRAYSKGQIKTQAERER
jgi:HD-GYP domain-containing protein (c-di-GMP phosphodiesterase class II)